MSLKGPLCQFVSNQELDQILFNTGQNKFPSSQAKNKGCRRKVQTLMGNTISTKHPTEIETQTSAQLEIRWESNKTRHRKPK